MRPGWAGQCLEDGHCCAGRLLTAWPCLPGGRDLGSGLSTRKSVTGWA